MSYQEFEENMQIFSRLMEELPPAPDAKMQTLIARYIEQNVAVLNDVFSSSIEHLKQIKAATSANEVICIQAKFVHEINKKLTLISRRFLTESLGRITDHNEWLKAHCDLATD